MKQRIIEIANSLGIEIIGFTSILNYSYLTGFLSDREKKGYNCEFEEQNTSKRLEARNVFPKCKSIIAIGIPYARGYKKPVSSNKGLLSIVSYEQDYHNILNELLKKLAEEIKRVKKIEYEICVDTSPLIDKEICKNAKIGSYGKNTLLINEKFGSFINIGYLLTDLEVECDNSTNNIDICGNCDICIKSCPNNAILKEGGINARRCISYLTQTKDYIPIEYRKNMKNQIYGCDICQIVCPKNKANSQKESHIDYSKLLINLEKLMKISNKDFKLQYGHLAGSWRGKNIWKRNALIAIANLKLESMFNFVQNELSNESDMIKIYALWCLWELNKEKTEELLISFKENDTIISEYRKLAEAENDSGNL